MKSLAIAMVFEEELPEADAEPAGHHEEGDDQPRCGRWLHEGKLR